jgi:hypothetical protein
MGSWSRPNEVPIGSLSSPNDILTEFVDLKMRCLN